MFLVNRVPWRTVRAIIPFSVLVFTLLAAVIACNEPGSYVGASSHLTATNGNPRPLCQVRRSGRGCRVFVLERPRQLGT